MYIVRQQKGNAEGQSPETQGSVMDKETMQNIKGLMDENVFELLDKTETKVL